MSEHPQMAKLFLVQSKWDKFNVENQRNKEIIMALENEVRQLQKQNNELSLAKTIVLRDSSASEPTDQLDNTLVDMSIK